MSRSTLFCLLLSCLVLPAKAQSPVQVVYVIDGSTLTTYNVDPLTLEPTAIETLTLPESNQSSLIASPNDAFIYCISYDSSVETRHLWVYPTDATGSPQGPPVQELNADNFYGAPVSSPKTNFLYPVTAVPTVGAEYENYTIWRYIVNPATGKITNRQSEARYKLPSGGGGSEYCGVFLTGFNETGTRMYDEIGCGYHGGASATYNERTVNPKTGALGPDLEVYSWNNSSSGAENVQFVKNLVFDLVMPNDYQPGIDSINVYPVQPNASSTPLVECTASMLEACGHLYGLNLVHPSGKYVFLGISSSTTQIEKVELGAHKIVDTSNYIPYTVQAFSPDGTIAYGVEGDNTGLSLEIHGLNVATGGVMPGGTVYVPSNLDPWFTAERY